MPEEKRNISVSMEKLAPVIIETVESGNLFPLTVKGNSMRPLLRDGVDTVFFASLSGHEPRRGDIVLYRRKNGVYVMHRVYRVNPDGTFDFAGDNQRDVEPGLNREQLLAYVPKANRSGKTVSCEKGFTHRFMVLYMMFRVRFPGLCTALTRFASKLKRLFTAGKERK